MHWICGVRGYSRAWTFLHNSKTLSIGVNKRNLATGRKSWAEEMRKPTAAMRARSLLELRSYGQLTTVRLNSQEPVPLYSSVVRYALSDNDNVLVGLTRTSPHATNLADQSKTSLMVPHPPPPSETKEWDRSVFLPRCNLVCTAELVPTGAETRDLQDFFSKDQPKDSALDNPIFYRLQISGVHYMKRYGHMESIPLKEYLGAESANICVVDNTVTQLLQTVNDTQEEQLKRLCLEKGDTGLSTRPSVRPDEAWMIAADRYGLDVMARWGEGVKGVGEGWNFVRLHFPAEVDSLGEFRAMLSNLSSQE